jgi:copper transport protein
MPLTKRTGIVPPVAVGLAANLWLASTTALYAATPDPAAPSAIPPHVELLATEPADGDTLSAAELGRVRLVFSGAVEDALSEIRISGPGGLDLSLDVGADPSTERALVAEAPALAAGAYRVTWRTVSVDGHARSGSFVFYISADTSGELSGGTETDLSREATAPAAESAAGAAGPGASQEPPPLSRDPLGLSVPVTLALARAVAVAALLSLGGLLAMIAWIAPGAARRSSRWAYLLAILVPFLLAAHLLLWLQSVSPGGGFEMDSVAALLGTQAGGLELLRFGLAIAALAALAFGRHVASAAFLTVLAALLSGATGHALLTEPALAVPAKAVHLLATQLWLGGLLYLLVEPGDDPAYAPAAFRVSRVALISVLAIAATGILQSMAALPSIGALASTDYGRLVLAKIGGLVILGLFGYRNQFRLLPALEEPNGISRLKGSVAWETLVMGLVFLVAAVLAYVPPDH